MKRNQFVAYVAQLVAKTAGQPLEDVDADHNVEAFYDDGMEPKDQRACAHLAATEVLEENGFVVAE
jgi:hypothetical protein